MLTKRTLVIGIAAGGLVATTGITAPTIASAGNMFEVPNIVWDQLRYVDLDGRYFEEADSIFVGMLLALVREHQADTIIVPPLEAICVVARGAGPNAYVNVDHDVPVHPAIDKASTEIMLSLFDPNRIKPMLSDTEYLAHRVSPIKFGMLSGTPVYIDRFDHDLVRLYRKDVLVATITMKNVKYNPRMVRARGEG